MEPTIDPVTGVGTKVRWAMEFTRHVLRPHAYVAGYTVTGFVDDDGDRICLQGAIAIHGCHGVMVYGPGRLGFGRVGE